MPSASVVRPSPRASSMNADTMLWFCGSDVHAAHEGAVDLQARRPACRGGGRATSSRCRSRRSRCGDRPRGGPRRIVCARSGSAIAEDSVISTITFAGSMPPSPIRSRIPFARSGCQNCRGERLKLVVEIDVQLAPRLRLVHELAHDPVADRLDQAELLGERDEVAGRHHRAVGLDPADQRLDTPHPARREVEDRLVVQRPSLALHRLAQAGHELELRRRVERAPVGDHVGVAALLGLQHRRVRVAQEAARLVAVLREQADPDRRRHVELRAAGPERHGERVEDPLRRRLRSSHGHLDVVTVAFEVGQQQQERVPRAPRHQIGLARRLAEPVGDDVQDLVARESPERVVHESEVVDVDADHGDGRPRDASRGRSRAPGAPRTSRGSGAR